MISLHSIPTGLFKLDGGAMFGVVPKSIWSRFQPADESNLCTWALRCLLVKEGDRRILIDTGIGDKQDEKFFSHYALHGEDSLDASLAQAGCTRGDITDVLHTHLHFDHCGGSVRREGDRLVPAFPNAVYWTNEAHWQWATRPNDREKASFLKENILPLQESGRLQFIPVPQKGEGRLAEAPFTEHISLRFAEGHTRAMMLPQIRVGDRTVVFMADLLPSANHIPLPYVMGYDMFPLTTLGEKKEFLEEALEKNYTLFFEHDAQRECCLLQHTEKGIRGEGSYTLAELIG